MRLADRLIGAFLRWGQVGLAGLLLLPFAVASGLGFVWLFERGWLLWFVLATALLFAAVRGARLFVLWRQRRRARGAAEEAVDGGEEADTDDGGVATGKPPARALRASPTDPDWTEAERAVYERARNRIAARLTKPLPWEQIPEEAFATVESVAADLSGGKRSALDFTLPEALLLVDRVALRYREFLRLHVPFSDQLSVRTLYWLWQRQDRAILAWETGFLAWRGIRLVVNPAVALMREAERAIAAGLQERLSVQFQRDAQAILLEEAAQAAVDLYSGRLRFSDAELAEISLDSERRDAERLATPDDPLRIVVVGQVSAGKSTLINALLELAEAETDMAPTTSREVAHEIEIDGTPCRLIDTPGLDGSEEMQRRLAGELIEADMVLWALRANRPGRAPDTALMARFQKFFADNPARRPPPAVLVATVADALLTGWPWPENTLPARERAKLGKAMAAIAEEMGGGAVIPLRAEPPEWNIDALNDRLRALIGEAAMVQRNRRRLAGDTAGWQLRGNLARARRGLGQGLQLLRRSLRRGRQVE
ncbi:MAG: 50S ribosome-binding GTPase [Pararhodobacter sp.]|nr:50S ribosome-binding GTPase [Pararhodobacter sp.]